MCEYCRTTPHHPRCPLADSPKSDIVCSHCNEDIIPNDEYVEINAKHYHLSCIENFSTRELLEMLDCEIQTKEDINEQYTFY